MDKRTQSPLDPYFGYCELHHKVPRSFGGKDYSIGVRDIKLTFIDSHRG